MKILLFFHAGSLNRGCEAIVRSGVSLLKSTKNIEVNLSSFNPQSDTIIPKIDTIFDASEVTFSKYSITSLIAALQFKLFKSEQYFYKKKFQKLYKQIPNHDVFLSIGGDNYCYGEQPWLYQFDQAVKKAGKKLVLWGASIGNEDLSTQKINDLKTFDLILARESLTFEILKSAGIKNIKLVADGAFLMEKEELPLPMGWQEGNTLGFNFSPLVWKRNKESQQAALKLVQHILDTTTMTICFTPHVIIPNNDDYKVLEEFYNYFKHTNRVILLPNNLNAIQYKGYISRMRYFIGARTHATIAAYASCVPTMVMGYSVKSKGIAKDIFGEEKLVLNINEISDSEKLIAKFEEMQRDEKQIITTLANKIPHIKQMAQKAADYLFEL